MAEKKIALFDMDDTLADYDGQLREDLKVIASPFEPNVDEIVELNQFDYLEARRHMITSRVGWFRNLPKFQLGMDILDMCVEIGYHNMIATKGPNTKPAAWTEKLQWCHQHLEDKIDGVTVTSDKGLLYGRVLVDDFPDYVLGWLKYRPRGLAIMPAHPKNAGFAHPQVIRYNGTNKHEVRAALQAAFDREEGETV